MTLIHVLNDNIDVLWCCEKFFMRIEFWNLSIITWSREEPAPTVWYCAFYCGTMYSYGRLLSCIMMVVVRRTDVLFQYVQFSHCKFLSSSSNRMPTSSIIITIATKNVCSHRESHYYRIIHFFVWQSIQEYVLHLNRSCNQLRSTEDVDCLDRSTSQVVETAGRHHLIALSASAGDSLGLIRYRFKVLLMMSWVKSSRQWILLS